MNTDVSGFGSRSLKNYSGMPKNSDIKEIKQMLLSGDHERVLLSIERIKFFLCKDESVVDLIQSDISEFLCDAMTPFDSLTFRAVYNCLESIVQYAEFFIQNHSCFVLESLIRCIHFLLKNTSMTSNLSECLNLLVLITQGFNTFRVMPEKETIENTLQIIPVLLKTTFISVKNKYQIGCILLNFADLNQEIWTLETQEIVADSFSRWIDLINEIFYSEHPLRENLIFICGFLSHFMLKSVLPNLNSSDLMGLNETSEHLKDELIVKISNFLIDIEAPYLDTLPLSVIENEPVKVEYFFQVVLYFYTDKILPPKNFLTHGLSEVGFLQFVTRVISFVDLGNSEQLRKLGVLVLSHTIMSLSEDVFQIPENGFNGWDDFRNEIQRGFCQLPLDASQWLDVLINPQSPKFCKIALLLYLYFYCMTAKSQSIIATIYPAILTFIDFSTGIESSPFLVKIIWFVFVMSQMSCTEHPRSVNDSTATSKMVAMLEVQENLRLIYTHHPALLYWAFSSDINSNIQSKIVHLWLENKSPDCRELADLIKNSPDVRFALLGILQNECGDVLDSAFSTLNSTLIDSGDENLISNIWCLLPQILAKFTTDSTIAKNVDYTIELCSLKSPKNFDMTKAIRIATLLPEVLLKSDLLSVVPSLNLTFRLLEMAFNMDDLRIMKVFIRSDDFMRKIVGGLESNVFEIVIMSVNILKHLWKNSDKCYKTNNFKKIKIGKETLLAVLESRFTEVVMSGLDFLEVILINNFRSAVFEFDEVDVQYLEILFFEVENICMKDHPSLTPVCWRCLKSFLLFDASVEGGEFVRIEFASDPLLNELVNFHLSRLREMEDMKDFLTLWLCQYNCKINDPCLERKIFGGYFRETLTNIGSYLRENLSDDNRQLYETVVACGFQD